MRQIVLQEPGRFLERHADPPVRGPREALIRIRSVGVCGSDFHAFAGRQPAYTFPRVIGHEIGCEVVEAPDNDRGIRPGDRCTVEPYIACGNCRPCRLKRTNCCENLRLFGLHVDGGMQGFLTVPLELLHKSEKLTVDQLALVETLGIGAHAVERGGLEEGEEALVVGAGPIGLAVIQFALAAGARVRVVEKNDLRRNFVAQFPVETLSEPGDRVYDAVFDATGNAQSMSQSLYSVAPAGRLVFVGLCPENIPINDPLLHKREITLYASRNSAHQFPKIIRMIEDGRIDTEPWITTRLPLADVPLRFADLQKRPNLIKAVVEVGESDI